MPTTIEWTDATWNPATGCTKVSPGCAHCYAERLAPKVFAGQTVTLTRYVPNAGRAKLPKMIPAGTTTRPRVFTDVRCHVDRLLQPLSWRRPRRVFVNSMSDLFHEDIPDDFLDRVFAVMASCPQHTFQVLTKREVRMRTYLSNPELSCRIYRQFALLPPFNRVVWAGLPLPNVWLGVSVESQLWGETRIGPLLRTPAAVRFISAEPLIGQLFVLHWLRWSATLPGLDWVIVGGESGPRARPCDLAWIQHIVGHCKATHTPVFVKQGGRSNGCAHSAKGSCLRCLPRALRVRQFPLSRTAMAVARGVHV